MFQILRQVAGSVGDALSAWSLPPLSDLYRHAALQDVSTRNPVVVIPGILGSKIQHAPSGQVIWGSHDRHAYPKMTNAQDMQRAAHPMHLGTPLRDLTDEVVQAGSIEHFRFTFLGMAIHVGAYASILRTLGVGGMLSEHKRGENRWSKIDYDESSIATCFQFAYDWRRSIPENAAKLVTFIDTVREFAAFDSTSRGVPKSPEDIRVDVVAHSMGGLLLRYFLRYADTPLDELTPGPGMQWHGAERVDNAILIGTPNAGSLFALSKLIEGLAPTPAMPGYDPTLLATYPTLYQLLPRERHQCFLDAAGNPIESLYDPDTWARMGWGLHAPGNERFLEMVLPDVKSSADRRAIALDHTAKCLREAELLHTSLDEPVNAPKDIALHLFAGDGRPTPHRAIVTPPRTNGRTNRKRYKVIEQRPGDGTVTRWSALHDERAGSRDNPRVTSPVRWDNVTFIPTGHMDLTRHPTFINNVLYTLLEKAPPDCDYRAEPVREYVAPRFKKVAIDGQTGATPQVRKVSPGHASHEEVEEPAGAERPD